VSTSLRVPLMLSILTTVACGELIGIRDVPIPDDGGADATTPDGARGSSSGDDRDTGLAGGDAPVLDAPVDEGPGTDGPSVTLDGAMESAVPEAGPPEAGRDTGVDTGCGLTWNPYTGAAQCNACGIMLCCGELATCEAVDDAGSFMGTSYCAAFVNCVAGRKGSGTPAGNETLCEGDVPVSSSERANADAALSCIRASCADCSGL
jgi:hypothetical protein